jgi:hypothetical protein
MSKRGAGLPADQLPTRTLEIERRIVSKPMNRGLGAAKAAKQDEFYTQYVDIQKEVEAYLEFAADTFRGKVVYCNCDDPFESNFLSTSPPILTNLVSRSSSPLATTAHPSLAHNSPSMNTMGCMASGKGRKPSPWPLRKSRISTETGRPTSTM